jgi:integrase
MEPTGGSSGGGAAGIGEPLPPVTLKTLACPDHQTRRLAFRSELHEVSDILRHSSIAVTKDVYGHLVPERLQAAADTMDRALRRKPAS